MHRIQMASVHAVKKETWHEGDRCLAPDPKDGTLREATIQRLSTSPEGPVAWVVLTKQCKNEEEAVPVSKLLRSGLNHPPEEKPVFPNRIKDSMLCVPLELNVNGDRVPYTINRYLRDYQREGIRFMYDNYTRSRGCILGDDMGLGKTVQVIAFLAAVLHKTGTWEDIQKNRPHFLQSQTHSEQNKPNKVFLIVAPLSVLYNWKDELEIWGHFRCVVVHGLKKEEELTRVKKGRTEIALTTYETLRLCLDEFNTIDWSAVVVDEAHRIKNPNSQITQAMKDLKCQIRIGLTGTILQNNLEELWCVMDWAIPGCLGSLGHFKNKYSYPIEQGQKHSTTKRTLAIGRKTVRALVRKISIWFLRRTKVHIKEQLPKKDDRVVFCSLTEFQQSVYQTVLDTEDVKLLLRSSEKCDCQSGRTRLSCCYKTNSEGVKVKELYFIYLAILRKVANNVALLQSTARTSKKQKKYIGTICAEVFQKFPDFVHRCSHESFEALSDPVYSGKMKVLEKLLKYYLQKRDKMLLFSLSTKLLDILESYCIAQGLDYSRLDGTTKAKERVQIVKEFNSSSHVNLCLVSTMAGGLGLNFVGANVVVLFDPTWNPANDLQAIDRAYRIGQSKDVTVLRLISLGSVEEIIYLRQVYKQQLQCTVVGKEAARRYFEAVHGDHKGELFGIKNLFRLQTQGTCLTQKILEREGQVEAGVMTTSVHKGEETAEKEERVSESAGPRDVADDKPISETRGGLQVPEAALDFSSGSEEDELDVKKKISNPSSVDPNKGGTVAPGQMTLLQHGFSKLLERVKGNPELAQGDSSSGVDESPFEEDAEDQNEKNARNAGNQEACPKLGTKTWDISSSSDREDWENKEEGRKKGVSLEKQGDESIRKRHSLKGWTNKITEDEESDDNSSPNKDRPNKRNRTVKKTHQTEFYSDESEDLDVEIIKRSKKSTLQSYTEEDKRRKMAECNRNKPSMSKCWDKATSKYKEDTEMFTSSEDEHNKGRPTGCHFASPPTDRSRVEMDKYGQSSSTKERPAGMTDAVSSLKCQAPLVRSRKDRTIDSVLGAVNEVMYTHSNQRVVGGSKAEELISRAAVRDVFERKMYSQLPANHIQDRSESLLASTRESQPSSSVVRLVKPTVDHPVTFAKKNVLHTEHTTFVIGETPQAIRRQQLEEMAEKFMFRSAHQFAVEILRSTSAQRLTWLRQYYTSLNHAGLSNTVTNNFPEPDSVPTPSSSSSRKTAATKSHTDTRTPQKHCLKAQKNPKYTQKYHKSKIMPERPQSNMTLSDKTSTNPQSGVQKPQKNLNVPQENILEPPNDVPSMESEGQEEMACSARGHKRTKRGSVSGSRAFRVGGGVGLDQASSSGLRSEEAAAFLDRDTRSSADFSHDRSTMLSKPTAQENKQEQKVSSWTNEKGQREKAQTLFPEQTTPTSSHSSFLADLIGDTSILDDLLKPKSRVSSIKTCTATPFSPRNNESGSLSSPKSTTQAAQQATSKCSRKDFWDILTEGNEESINRLTDPAEVQRVCINTNFAAGSRAGETESKSLWKTNENFLWKK